MENAIKNADLDNISVLFIWNVENVIQNVAHAKTIINAHLVINHLNSKAIIV
jgi:hypothetical protein